MKRIAWLVLLAAGTIGACAQATGEGTLVLVYADPAHACRAGGAA